MLYEELYRFGKIDQDTAPDKRDTNTHFNITNMETYFTDRGLSLTVTQGPGDANSYAFVPGYYPGGGGTPAIVPYSVIGEGHINDRLFIFCTARRPNILVGDIPLCKIMEVVTSPTGDVSLRQVTYGQFYFDVLNPIDCVGYRESEDIYKLYFVDGFNQARFVDVDNPADDIGFVLENTSIGDISATQNTIPASINAITRYGYSMYNIGGTSSKVSAFTKPINLSILGDSSASVTISNLPSTYDNLRVYRIIYRTYNSPPTFELMYDSPYTSGGSFTFTDNGELLISTLDITSVSEIGSDYIVATTLDSKKQHLFFGNITVEPFIIKDWDGRAYGYWPTTTGIWIEIVEQRPGTTTTYYSYDDVPEDSNCIPPTKTQYNRTIDRNVFGMEGENVIIEMHESTALGGRKYKMGESYRVGVQGQDKYMRWSTVIWCGDIYIPYMPKGVSITAKVKNGNSEVLKWKFVIVERTEQEKTVLAQGFTQPIMKHSSVLTGVLGLTPFPNIKTMVRWQTGVVNTAMPFALQEPYNTVNPSSVDWDRTSSNRGYDIAQENHDFSLLVSPETALQQYNLGATKARLVGCRNTKNTMSYAKMYDGGTNGGGTSEQYITPIGNQNLQTRWGSEFPTSIHGVPICVLGTFHDGVEIGNGRRRISYGYQRETIGDLIVGSLEEVLVDDVQFMDNDDTILLDSKVIDNSANVTPLATILSQNEDDSTNWGSEACQKYAIKFNLVEWSGTIVNNAGFNKPTFSKFPQPSDLYDKYLPIIDLIRPNDNQYGGLSFSAKSNNIYIDASEGVNVGVFTELWGDTYLGLYAFPYTTGARYTNTNQYTSMYDYFYVTMESTVDPNEFNYQLNPSSNINLSKMSDRLLIESGSWEKYNQVYSQPADSILSAAVPFNLVEIYSFFTRIVPTNAKFPGEQTDGWTEIQTGNGIDIENMYGGITKLTKAGDALIAFQPKGIAAIRVYPVAQTTTAQGSVQLGRGTILDNYEYLFTEIGAASLNSIRSVDKQIFFIDAYNQTLNSMSGGDLSTLQGFNSLIKEWFEAYPGQFDLPIDPFVSINRDKKEVHFRVLNKPTLVYNYVVGVFTHMRTYNAAEFFIGFDTRLFISANQKLYTADTGTIGDYFGITYDASIEMFVEPMPGVDKVFDAIKLMKYGEETIDEVSVTSPTRISGVQPTNIKTKFDIHSFHLPRALDALGNKSRVRFRERNIKIKLIYNKAVKFVLDSITVKFTPKK